MLHKCRWTLDFSSAPMPAKDAQHQIRHQRNRRGSVYHVTEVLAAGDRVHRTALAERLCAGFGFLDGRGQPQVSTCLSALQALDRSGQVRLPTR